METFGERLKAALKHAKKTRNELAAKLGISVQAIGQVIRGESQAMSAANAATAAAFLKVNVIWLTTGRGPMAQQETGRGAHAVRERTPDYITDLAMLASPKSQEVLNKLAVAARLNKLRDEDWAVIEQMADRLLQK